MPDLLYETLKDINKALDRIESKLEVIELTPPPTIEPKPKRDPEELLGQIHDDLEKVWDNKKMPIPFKVLAQRFSRLAKQCEGFNGYADLMFHFESLGSIVIFESENLSRIVFLKKHYEKLSKTRLQEFRFRGMSKMAEMRIVEREKRSVKESIKKIDDTQVIVEDTPDFKEADEAARKYWEKKAKEPSHDQV